MCHRLSQALSGLDAWQLRARKMNDEADEREERLKKSRAEVVYLEGVLRQACNIITIQTKPKVSHAEHFPETLDSGPSQNPGDNRQHSLHVIQMPSTQHCNHNVDSDSIIFDSSGASWRRCHNTAASMAQQQGRVRNGAGARAKKVVGNNSMQDCSRSGAVVSLHERGEDLQDVGGSPPCVAARKTNVQCRDDGEGSYQLKAEDSGKDIVLTDSRRSPLRYCFVWVLCASVMLCKEA